MPVVFLALTDAVYAKARSNMQEVKARGGRIIAIEGNGELAGVEEQQLCIPTGPLLSPVLTTIPLESWRPHRGTARLRRGPARNLTKSVTVE